MARIPLQPNLRPRDSDGEKDSLLVNGFVEKSAVGVLRTVKRPGLLVEVAGAGVPGAGMFTYGDYVYSWTASTPPLTPLVVAVSDLKTRKVVTDVAMADDQYRFVIVYPGLFDAWTTGSYFLGTSIPLTAGTTIEEGTSSTSQPITVVGGSTFTYREKVNTGVTASGSGELIATLSGGNLFTLVNTIDLGSVSPCGAFATDTALYVVVDNATAHWRVGVITDLDAGGISVDGASNADQFFEPYTVRSGGTQYNVLPDYLGSFTASYANTPYTDWSGTITGSGDDSYRAYHADVFGGLMYCIRGYVPSMALGLYSVNLTTGNDSAVSPSGLPTTGYGYVFAGGSYLYLFHFKTGTNSTIYRSSDASSWSSFYTTSAVWYYYGAAYSGSVVYVFLSANNGTPGTLLTLSGSGGTEQATGITEATYSIFDRPFYINGALYYIQLVQGGGQNLVKIWKKTG